MKWEYPAGLLGFLLWMLLCQVVPSHADYAAPPFEEQVAPVVAEPSGSVALMVVTAGIVFYLGMTVVGVAWGWGRVWKRNYRARRETLGPVPSALSTVIAALAMAWTIPLRAARMLIWWYWLLWFKGGKVFGKGDPESGDDGRPEIRPRGRPPRPGG